jgi:hypothetical protein
MILFPVQYKDFGRPVPLCGSVGSSSGRVPAGLGLARPDVPIKIGTGPASTALQRGLQSPLAQNRKTIVFLYVKLYIRRLNVLYLSSMTPKQQTLFPAWNNIAIKWLINHCFCTVND